LLDREDQEARRPRQRDGVDAERAAEYRQALGDAWWLAEGGPGRAAAPARTFKEINGAFGLRIGDDVVRRIGRLLRAHSNSSPSPEEASATGRPASDSAAAPRHRRDSMAAGG
jgi:hypothetical protein